MRQNVEKEKGEEREEEWQEGIEEEGRSDNNTEEG